MTAFKDEKIVELSNSIIKHITSEEKLEQVYYLEKEGFEIHVYGLDEYGDWDEEEQDSEYIKYDETILDKTLTPRLYENDFMNNWLKKMQPLVSLLFDQMNVMKNFKNYMVDKYHWKQR